MPANDTRQAMRGSTDARITPTAPPMLWPAYAIVPTPQATSASIDAAEVAHFLGGDGLLEAAFRLPLPANDTRSEASPASDSASASAMSSGRSLCAVTPCAMTTTASGTPDGVPGRRLIGDVEPLALRVSDDAQRRAHRPSTSAIRRSTASSTKAGSSAWAARSTISMLAGTCAFSSAKKIASSVGSFRGPPGIA